MTRASSSEDDVREAKEETSRASGLEDDLEKEVWRCLNSVHDLLRRREVLNQILRQGWMELVSARYEMGPARISQPLFSLKPQASKAAVDVSRQLEGGARGAVLGEDEDREAFSTKGPVFFNFIRDTSEREPHLVADADGQKHYSIYRNRHPSSQLRRRFVSTLADDEKDEILTYDNLIDDSDSDSEDDPSLLKVQKTTLQGFGAIVSPHLRSAQGTFLKALQLAAELLNAQSEAMDAHSKVTSIQRSTDLQWGSDDHKRVPAYNKSSEDSQITLQPH